MTPGCASLALGGAAFAVHAAIVILAARPRTGANPMAVHAVSAAVSELVFVAVAWMAPEPIPFWHGSIALGFGVVCWMFVFSAAYKSVSLRILLMLDKNPDQGIAVERITRDFIRPTFAERINVIETLGYAEARASGYVLTDAGRAFVRRVSAVRAAFGISSGGFYTK